MSDQDLVGTGAEASPTRDDQGQLTDEALMERMFVQEEPTPVESQETEQETAEEYEEEAEVETAQAEDDGDDYEEDAEEAIDESYGDDSEEEPQSFTVKIDGKEHEVNLDELKRGYSGQQYIQQQMNKVAESRKETEAIYGQLAQERAQVQQALQLLTDGTLSAPPVAPDEALFNSDPLAYMEQKLQYDKQVEEYQQRVGYLQQQVSANHEQHAHMRQAYLAKEAEMLKGYAPELFDDDKGTEVRNNLINTVVALLAFVRQSTRHTQRRSNQMPSIIIPEEVIKIPQNKQIIFDIGKRLQQTRQFKFSLCASGNVPGMWKDTASFIKHAQTSGIEFCLGFCRCRCDGRGHDLQQW